MEQYGTREGVIINVDNAWSLAQQRLGWHSNVTNVFKALAIDVSKRHFHDF